MPVPTPGQKVDQVRMFGGAFVDIQLIGDTFDDSSKAAQQYQKENNLVFIHPFDDVDVIEGQATIALEIIEHLLESKHLGQPDPAHVQEELIRLLSEIAIAFFSFEHEYLVRFLDPAG